MRKSVELKSPANQRFSDPHFAYIPRKPKEFPRKPFKDEKKDTPIGQLTNESWDYLVKKAKNFETSGMQTMLLPVLPPVISNSADEELMRRSIEMIQRDMTRSKIGYDPRSTLTGNFPATLQNAIDLSPPPKTNKSEYLVRSCNSIQTCRPRLGESVRL